MSNNLSTTLQKTRNAVVRSKLRLTMQGYLSPLLVSMFSPRTYNYRKTLVVAGAPRSGTTWLAEIVNTIPGSSILFEPLDLNKVQAASKAGFSGDTYVADLDYWPEGNRFIEKILQGKVRNRWTLSHIPPEKAFNTTTWVVKFVRANMLLGWLVNTFEIRPPALIIRHPCATISSQLKKGWLAPDHAPVNNDFIRAHPHLHKVVSRYTTMEEYLAAWWCMRYSAPMASAQSGKIALICYERLVTEGENELKRLFGLWGEVVIDEAVEQLKRPSMTTASYSSLATQKSLLTGWKNSLSNDQVDKILGVLQDFGLEFYNRNPEPDYAGLYPTIQR